MMRTPPRIKKELPLTILSTSLDIDIRWYIQCPPSTVLYLLFVTYTFSGLRLPVSELTAPIQGDPFLTVFPSYFLADRVSWMRASKRSPLAFLFWLWLML